MGKIRYLVALSFNPFLLCFVFFRSFGNLHVDYQNDIPVSTKSALFEATHRLISSFSSRELSVFLYGLSEMTNIRWNDASQTLSVTKDDKQLPLSICNDLLKAMDDRPSSSAGGCSHDLCQWIYR
jgi:hypothetical protein